MKLTISTTLFYGNHIFDVLPQLKGERIDGIELRLKEPHFDYNEDTEIEELKRRAKKEKVRILSLHAPSGIDISGVDEWGRVKSVREVEKAIVIASRLGAEYVVVHPGEERKEDEQFEELKKSLAEIVEFSQDWGVSILIENTQPGKVGDDPGELKRMLDMVDTSVGFCLDTSHLNLYGMTMSEGMRILGGNIKEIHLSDNFGEKDDHVLPYEGKIDWTDFLKGIKALNFKGVMCFELMAREDCREVIRKIQEIYEEWQKKVQEVT